MMPSILKYSITFLVIACHATDALALKCARAGQPDQIADYKHIFIARVTEAAFIPEAENPDVEGRTVGHFIPLEVIKGDPGKVPHIEASVPVGIPCGGCLLPVLATGYTYVVFAEKDGPVQIDDCAPTKIKTARERECYAYAFRKEAGLIDTNNDRCDQMTNRATQARQHGSAAPKN